MEAEEKRLARRVAGLQVAVALLAAGAVYGLNGADHAAAVLGGGSVSAINGALLAWRMSRTALHSADEACHSGGAQRQLRLMYFYAAERFLAVVVLLGICMAALELPPLAVLGGFALGQAVLLVARLFLNGSDRSWIEK